MLSRKTIAVIGIVLVIILSIFNGCSSEETSRGSSSGTPVIDRNESAFDLSEATMRDTPDSSCFSSIGYCRDREILVVTFRDSGNTYIYEDFPYSEWKDFSSASSLGSYYNANIKGCYTSYMY